MATHGVLSDPAVDRLKTSPISRVVVTDTLPVPAGAAASTSSRCCRWPDHRRRHRRRVRGHLGLARSSAARTWPEAGGAPDQGRWSGVACGAATLVGRSPEAARPSATHRSRHLRRSAMAEVILAAEVGRPTGSRAARRLRREGKIPGVVYGHGTEPLPVAVVARELRVALSARRAPTSCSPSTTGPRHVPRPRPRDPAPPGAPDGDPRRLPDRPPRRGHQRRRAVILVGEASRCTTATGWSSSSCSRSPSTPCRPTSPPPSRSTSPSSPSAAQVRVVGPGAARGRHHRRRPRDGDRHRAAAAGRRDRRGGEARRPRARPARRRGGRRRVGRGRSRRGLGPAPPLRPVASAGARRPTCWSSGWATPAPSSPGAATTSGPTPSSCWLDAPRRRRSAAEKGVQRPGRPRCTIGGRPGGRWPCRRPT